MSASAQGPVRPVWLQGSRVTTAVAPRAAPGDSFDRASTSACGVLAPRCHPSARTRPSGDSSTAPTWGLTPRGPWSASASARLMALCSASVTVIRLPCLAHETRGEGRTTARAAQPVRLPSGLDSACALHHRRSRISTGSASARSRREQEPQLADCHRRFGFSPTPEHVDALSVVNAPRGRFIPCRRATRVRRADARSFTRTSPPDAGCADHGTCRAAGAGVVGGT